MVGDRRLHASAAAVVSVVRVVVVVVVSDDGHGGAQRDYGAGGHVPADMRVQMEKRQTERGVPGQVSDDRAARYRRRHAGAGRVRQQPADPVLGHVLPAGPAQPATGLHEPVQDRADRRPRATGPDQRGRDRLVAQHAHGRAVGYAGRRAAAPGPVAGQQPHPEDRTRSVPQLCRARTVGRVRLRVAHRRGDRFRRHRPAGDAQVRQQPADRTARRHGRVVEKGARGRAAREPVALRL